MEFSIQAGACMALVCGLACASAESDPPARVAPDPGPPSVDAVASPSAERPAPARAFDPSAFGLHPSAPNLFALGAPATREQRLDALVSPLIEGQWLAGVSIALVEDGDVHTYGYGALGEGGPVPDGRTLFEIGSVTKTFTSLLLAELVRDGSVELDQPVASLLPEGVSVPELDGRGITLLDLATHTSGLPRQPTNWLSEAPTLEQLLDPYADYQIEDLYQFLSGYTLEVAPGERFEYSNVGTGLLGHALSLAAGTSYEAAIEARIARPLGLADTTLHPNAEQTARLATGHDVDLAAVPGWAFTPAIEAAGALRSTAEDMGRYIAAELAAGAPAVEAGAAADAGALPAPLLESMALTQAPQRTTDLGNAIGLAWFHAGPDTLQHSGQTGGYSSFALLDRSGGVGVVVLTNTVTVTGLVDALGEQLHQLLLGSTPAPLDLPVFIQPDAAALERCVGTYRSSDELGLDISVVRDGDRLYAEGLGSRGRLHPISESTFYLKTAGVVLRFEGLGAEHYLSMIVQYSADETYRATRL